IYEDQYLTRYPVNENIHLACLPYDVGVLHYASDTPYTHGRNLGTGNLSYFGMDATYGCSVAIVRRIFEQEVNRYRLTEERSSVCQLPRTRELICTGRIG